MSYGDILAVAWIVDVSVLLVMVGVAFTRSRQLQRLFVRYGSTIIPNVVDLLRIKTPASGIRLQKYILSKAYQGEAQPQLRMAGRRVRILSITCLALTMLMFLIMALIFWYGSLR